MGNRPKPRSASPLRAALAAKTSLRTYHDIAIVASEQVERAQRNLESARQMHVATLLHPDEAVKQQAKELLAKAEEQRGECFHRIWFRGLGFSEFDALVDLHPPTDEQAKAGKAWNDATFPYALLAECAGDSVEPTKDNPDGWVPGDLTAEEWEAELTDETRWSAADRRRVISMALAAQQQTMADAVPKD